MNIERLKKQLKIDEGYKCEVYLDSEGLPTCGIGHLITKKDPEFKLKVGTRISPERVDELFNQDLKICLDDCKIVFKAWDSMQDELQQIIANMMFNLGRGRFQGFQKMIVHIEHKNYLLAAAEMINSKWYEQVGKRSERLYNRMINLIRCSGI